jgi:hypothetical protein
MAVRSTQPALASVTIGVPVPLNWQASIPVAQVLVVQNGVATWNVEYTLDNILEVLSDNSLRFGANGVNATWQPLSTMTAKTATADATVNFPCSAVRLNMTAYTNGTGAILKVLQGDTI